MADSNDVQAPIANDAPTCPACEHPKEPVATECPNCGVIYARARPRSHPRPEAVPPPKPKAKRNRVVLPSRKRESLFTTMAEALDAGLTFQAYAESAAVRTLPTSMAGPPSAVACAMRSSSASAARSSEGFSTRSSGG